MKLDTDNASDDDDSDDEIMDFEDDSEEDDEDDDGEGLNGKLSLNILILAYYLFHYVKNHNHLNFTLF